MTPKKRGELAVKCLQQTILDDNAYQMKLVGGLTLRKLASFPQSAFLKPHLDDLDKELQAIE